MIATRRRSLISRTYPCFPHLPLAATKFGHLEARRQPGARPRPRADLQCAAKRCDALAHPQEAQAIADDLVAGFEAGPGICNLDLNRVAAALAPHGLPVAAGVAVGIVQGLLRETVQARLDLSGDIVRQSVDVAPYRCRRPALVVANGQTQRVARRDAAQLGQGQAGGYASDLGERLLQRAAYPFVIVERRVAVRCSPRIQAVQAQQGEADELR